MSATKGTTSCPLWAAISLATRSTSASVRAQMATRQPSCDRASADPRPRPLDAAVTNAILPVIPKFMSSLRSTVGIGGATARRPEHGG